MLFNTERKMNYLNEIRPLRTSVLIIFIAAFLAAFTQGCKKDENPSEPEVPEQPKSGLFVSTFPQGAEIFVDSVSTGKVSPALITGISSGPHKLLLTRVDYEDYTTSIYMKSNRIDTLYITLKRQQ